MALMTRHSMWIRCIFHCPSLPFLPLERRDVLCFALSNVTVTSVPSSALGVDGDTVNPCFMGEDRAWTGLPRTSQLGGGRAGIGLQSAWPQGTQLPAEGFPAHGRPSAPPHSGMQSPRTALSRGGEFQGADPQLWAKVDISKSQPRATQPPIRSLGRKQ